MSDAYSDWCDWKYEEEQKARQAEREKYHEETRHLIDECMEARKIANMSFIKCCATCGHYNDGMCYRLGYWGVKELATCKLWEQADDILPFDSDRDELEDMFIPFARASARKNEKPKKHRSIECEY